MTWILFLNLLVLLGFTLAVPSGNTNEYSLSQDASLFAEASIRHQINKRGLNRVTRNTFSGLGGQFLPRLEASIVSNCKANGHVEEANQLQSAYDEMKTCIKKKTMLISPKDEFIANLEECSKESIKLTKSCLAENQRYFPEFILDLAKSVVSFMYDDIDIMRVDLAACIPRFNSYSVQRSYIQCLTDSSTRTHDTSEIPTSKASFCEKFIPATQCFTDMIKSTCDRTPNLDKFRRDYLNANKNPCEKKE